MQQEVKEAVLRYLNDAKPGRILDIPSGSCWLLEHLDSSAWDYFAADLFATGPARQFQRVDLNQPFPYDDDYFDYVACLEGLEHVENYHHCLREIRRILKPGGKLIVSTPNPLNVKSRIRFLLWGTFYGFPHLVRMPADGEHLHMSPINLSFLISFAAKYGLQLERVHPLSAPRAMYRFAAHALVIQAYARLKLLFKDQETKEFAMRLHTWNVLLNDEIVVSFIKQ